jgi:hypothetical protein
MVDKGLKTFNLPLDTIRIVKTKPNQSAFVNKAIIRLHVAQKEFRLWDVDVEEMLIHCAKMRGSCPPHIKAVILEHYKEL